ncbi:hypothetical protein BSZ21_34690 [Bradyrhizobium canariense]|nr:hypothetical protein BSZ21_34690 [Bradyrhizobium canariense]
MRIMGAVDTATLETCGRGDIHSLDLAGRRAARVAFVGLLDGPKGKTGRPDAVPGAQELG